MSGWEAMQQGAPDPFFAEQRSLVGKTFQTEAGTATVTGPAASPQYVNVEVRCGHGVVLRTVRLEKEVRAALERQRA